jgi:hypothetical protein
MNRFSLLRLATFILGLGLATGVVFGLASEAQAATDSVKIIDLDSGEAMTAPVIILPERPLPPIRPLPFCRHLPDLVVSALPNPEFDAATRGSIIKAVVRNQGRAASSAFIVRLVVDGSTSVNVAVRGLGAMSSTIVTFRIPFWVYNPDAQYTVTVDASGRIRECNEVNNSKSFFGLG